MQPDLGLVGNMLVPILILWIIGYGFSMIVKKQKVYLYGSYRIVTRPVRHIYKKNKKLFVGLILGALIALYLSLPHP